MEQLIEDFVFESEEGLVILVKRMILLLVLGISLILGGGGSNANGIPTDFRNATWGMDKTDVILSENMLPTWESGNELGYRLHYEDDDLTRILKEDHQLWTLQQIN